MQEGKIETAKITFRQTIDLAKIAKSGQCFRWRELSDETYGTVWGIPSAGAYTRAIRIQPGRWRSHSRRTWRSPVHISAYTESQTNRTAISGAGSLRNAKKK